MGGIFSKPKAPAYTPPPPPTAPVEEATFQAGSDKTDTQRAKMKLGKKRLQIPLGTTTTASTGTGVSTGV